MAPMRGIVLLIVGLTWAVSTHCFSFHHRPREAVNHPSVRDTIARMSLADDFDFLRKFSDDLFQRKSAKDPQQAAYQESYNVRNSEGRRVPRGPLATQSWSYGRSRKHGKRQEIRAREAPVAKPWPEEFTVNFTTDSGTATGFVAYDWSQKRQIIYHGPKSTYCASFGTDEACQMFEFPGGTYVYIPALEQCFLNNAEVGSLPPEWTTYSEYVGVEEVPGVGLCRSYAFPPTVHVWYETVEESLPCLFVFPVPSESYYFLPETFEIGTPDEKYFDFPDYCFSEGDTVIKTVV